MNDLKTLLTNVRDQQDGLEEEFEKTQTLRVKSYQAGYRKGVMPFKHSLETKLTELERERQRHTDLLNGLDEEYKRTADARQATYEAGFEKGLAIRQRRKRFLTFLFPKRSKQSEVSP